MERSVVSQAGDVGERATAVAVCAKLRIIFLCEHINFELNALQYAQPCGDRLTRQ